MSACKKYPLYKLKKGERKKKRALIHVSYDMMQNMKIRNFMNKKTKNKNIFMEIIRSRKIIHE